MDVFMKYQIEKFFYDKPTKTLTADASCLGFPPGRWPFNITVKGMTGKEIDFVLMGPRNDREGEAVCQIYKPMNSTLDVKISIYND